MPVMYIRKVIKAKPAISKGPLLCLIFQWVVSHGLAFPSAVPISCGLVSCCWRRIGHWGLWINIYSLTLEVLAGPESTSFHFSNGWVAETWMKTFCLSFLSRSCPSTQERDLQGVLHPLGWRNVLCDRDLVKRSKYSADWKIGAVSNYELILPR